MHDLCRGLISQHGDRVQSGPFAGLRFPPECLLACCNSPGLLGTYEMELHPCLERIDSGIYEKGLDIGCADGYYAVGIAMRAGIYVDAFDPALSARRLCRSMAKLNGVSSLVHIHSWCSSHLLSKLAGRRCFVVSDCEGFEASLFSEAAIEGLRNSDVIIELHDGQAKPGTMRQLLEPRFSRSHSVQFVAFRPRTITDFPYRGLLNLLGEDAV